jgi:hypothetical protein
MKILQTIGSLILKARRPVKSGTEIPVAVRPITGLDRAPLHTVQRPTLAAALSAWIAVQTLTPERSFLKGQHALYRRSAPREVSAPIPETDIDANTGELVITYPAGDSRHPTDTIFDGPSDIVQMRSPLAAEAAFQRNASNAAGDAVARKLEEHEGDVRMADRSLRDFDEQLERVDRERNDAAAARMQAVENGAVSLDAPIAVPSVSKILLWRLFEAGTIGSESLCTFAALANASGIDPGNLSVEWRTDAPVITGWIIASVVIAATLFNITEWGFARIGEVIELPYHRSRLSRLATGSAALLSVLLAVVAIAALRAQLLSVGHASVLTTGIYLVLGLLPLIGGALAHMHADSLNAVRREALAAAAKPNASDVAVQLRSAHEETIIAQRDRLRARRENLINEIQSLHASMHGAEQLVRDGARHETRVVEVWLDSLRAALALDKKYFEYFARARDRASLLVPGEQPPPTTAALVPLRKRSAS